MYTPVNPTSLTILKKDVMESKLHGRVITMWSFKITAKTKPGVRCSNIVSLTKLLRGQLVNHMPTILYIVTKNTVIFC